MEKIKNSLIGKININKSKTKKNLKFLLGYEEI